jgi:acetyltransferase-like isoleucine patch superfamily enzyme
VSKLETVAGIFGARWGVPALVWQFEGLQTRMQFDSTTAQSLWHRHRITFHPRVRDPVPVQGAESRFERFTQHLPGALMPLGSYSYCRSHFGHVARIGRYCSIGAGVQVMGDSHPTDWVSSSPVFYRRKRAGQWGSARQDFPDFRALGPPVQIADDVWIGDDVLLAHGVRLGTGCIVAARSVVTRDVEPYAIVGGAPARVIRMRFPDALIERLLASHWWDWPVQTWDAIDPAAIERFLDHADTMTAAHPPMPEHRFTLAQALAPPG